MSIRTAAVVLVRIAALAAVLVRLNYRRLRFAVGIVRFGYFPRRRQLHWLSSQVGFAHRGWLDAKDALDWIPAGYPEISHMRFECLQESRGFQ